MAQKASRLEVLGENVINPEMLQTFVEIIYEKGPVMLQCPGELKTPLHTFSIMHDFLMSYQTFLLAKNNLMVI